MRGDWLRVEEQLTRVEEQLQGLGAKVDHILVQLNKILGQELSQGKKEKQIMADVKIAQETLDADGDKLSQLAADLQSLLTSGNLSDADQTKLQAGIDALTSLDTVQVTPPAPAPDQPTE